jgi:hypothetical protein
LIIRKPFGTFNLRTDAKLMFYFIKFVVFIDMRGSVLVNFTSEHATFFNNFFFHVPLASFASYIISYTIFSLSGIE